MATYYYDKTSPLSTAGFGTLTGNWTDAAWSTSSAGTSATGIAWPGAGNVATFGGLSNTATGGTVTAAATVSLDGITVQNLTTVTTQTLTGSTLAFAAVKAALAVGSAGTGNLTIDSLLTGTNGFTKSAAGTLTLSGSNTGLSGSSTLSGGTTRGTSVSAFGTGSVTVSTGAVMEVIAGGTYANVLNAAAGTIRNVSGNNTLSGTLTLAGTTTLESLADTLALTSATAITGSGQALVVNANGGDVSISQLLNTGGGTLTKNGSNKLTLTSTSTTAATFSGGTNLNAGTLEVFTTAPLSTFGAVVFGAGSTGTLRLINTAPLATTKNLTFDGATTAGLEAAATYDVWALTLNPTTLTVTGSSGIELKGSNGGFNTLMKALTGNQTLTKSGTGRWIMTGANNLTGTTTVSAGKLMAANAAYNNNLLGGSVVVSAGAEIQLGGEGDQKGRCAYTNLTVGGTSGNPARVRIGGASTNITTYLNGNLDLPSSGTVTWDLADAGIFKSPGTYTLFAFGTGFGVTIGGVAASPGSLSAYVTFNNVPTGRFVSAVTYTTPGGGAPNAVTVTIS